MAALVANALCRRIFGNTTTSLSWLGSCQSFSNSSNKSRLFEQVADETLESLYEYLDELMDSYHGDITTSSKPNGKNVEIETAAVSKADLDVSLSDGVLVTNFGPATGTYVINKQTPNQQIWLSSPFSGPKRYDYFVDTDSWIYKHDNRSLHQLLQNEIPTILKCSVNFFSCKHSGHGDSD